MTVHIEGSICTPHTNAACVAGALASDNLANMKTQARGGIVRTDIRTERLRSLVASVDDYLMNLAIAEDMCGYVSEKTTPQERKGPSASLHK
jgi:hypothetical protein